MSNRRTAHLDALERRLTGPRRVALFGHRAVGKTTLLAMFYREAAAGRVPGLRLAALGARTAEYLADKIARLEAGEPPAGTLAETELSLRLYHGVARFDLIVKDYQGEHVGLGSDAPIREFFADCDAVLLCLDPDGSGSPVERRRRQQEVEELLERYIEATDDGTAGRPVALLVTKYDRVLAAGGPPPAEVEGFVSRHYGMTHHALARHAPHSAIFAVSSYGGGGEDGRPPAELHPTGLEGPLAWLAERLESWDREQLEWLWDLAPDDLPRMTRCVRAYERRYPQSPHAIDYRRRLSQLRRRKLRRLAARLAVGAAAVVGGLFAYDAWGYRAALAFERQADSAPAVERRWSEFLAWHPTQPFFAPGEARSARHRLREWTVKAAAHRLAVGTAGPDLPPALSRIKDEAPDLAAAVRRVEEAGDRRKHDERWRAVQAAELAADAPPDERLGIVKAFLRDYPWTPNRAEALSLRDRLAREADERRDRTERQVVDALVRDAGLPGSDPTTTIEKARGFLDGHPESRWRGDVETLMADAARRLDEADIARARDYSKQYPANFAMRARRYEDYLKDHKEGGRFVREAIDALDRIDRERDLYTYRIAYDHAVAHPDDVAEVARRLRSYLDARPEGRFARDAKAYLAWWDRLTAPNDYHVTLKSAEVEPDVGKYLSGGAPDLSVEVWVGGEKYGPAPVVKNSHAPIWNYTFPRPIRWKLGDPVVVRILDYDWGASGVFVLRSPKDDRLAIRLLSGEMRPSKGGRTRVVFASDFRMPTLTKP